MADFSLMATEGSYPGSKMAGVWS